MDIQVIKKIAYGHERFYPSSNDAKFISKLVEQPTLTRRQLQLCKDYGWHVLEVCEQSI